MLLYSGDTVPSSKALSADGVTLSEDEHLSRMDESDENTHVFTTVYTH